MTDALRQLDQRVYAWVSEHRHRLVLWLPLLLMAGIGLYFAMPTEPPRWLGMRVLGAQLVLLLLVRRTRLSRWILLFFLPITLGFGVSQLRTETVKTPLLAKEMMFVPVSGTVEEVQLTEKGARLLLSEVNVEGLKPKQTPRHVRVAVRKGYEELQPRDEVRMQATLFPLPSPALPGGYDFGRHFYYQSIGAVGFAPKAPELIRNAEQGAWTARVQRVRQGLAQELIDRMGLEGTIAAALTVGEKGAIPEAEQEAMRTAGLAHVLAISGLHLAVAAGVVFFWIRLLLVAIPRVGLRVPAKKIAAAFSLIAAFGYLVLAGMPISAQRSFVMVAFVLIAVMLDRRGISLYSLAWAAVVVLIFFPESLLGPSFQMSFAATLAILGLYERYGKYLTRSDVGVLRKLAIWVVALAATSLVATLATAPFVIYHFNRLPAFGLLANMVAMPLVSFIIMPGVVLTLLLHPFGLEGIGVLPLEYGIRWMMVVAHWTSSLPYASIPVHSLTSWGVSIAGVGLIWLVLVKGRWRLLGVVMLVAGLLSSTLYRMPDMLVSDDGKQVLVRLDDGRYTYLRGTGRSFVAEVWQDALAFPDIVSQKEIKALPGSPVVCENTTCWSDARGVKVAAVRHSRDLPEVCAKEPDIIVIWWYVKQRECLGAKLLLDKNALKAGGARAFYFTPDGIEWRAARKPNVQRAWMLRERDRK